MNLIERFKVTDDFNSISAEGKLENLLDLMEAILRYEHTKFWRKRFASEEQYEEEFGEDREVELAIAWKVMKHNYTNYFQEINEAASKLDKAKKDLFETIKKYAEEDMDAILLEDDEE